MLVLTLKSYAAHWNGPLSWNALIFFCTLWVRCAFSSPYKSSLWVIASYTWIFHAIEHCAAPQKVLSLYQVCMICCNFNLTSRLIFIDWDKWWPEKTGSVFLCNLTPSWNLTWLFPFMAIKQHFPLFRRRPYCIDTSSISFKSLFAA